MGKAIFQKRAYQRSVPILLIGWLMVMVLPGLVFAECPQNRKTPTAPKEFLTMQNPLALNGEILKAGEHLFQLQGKPIISGDTETGGLETEY